MLDQKRVDREISRLRAALPSSETRKAMDYAVEDLNDYLAGQIPLFGASGLLDSIAGQVLPASFALAETQTERQDVLAFMCSLQRASFDMHLQAKRLAQRTFFNPSFGTMAGTQAPLLQSAGWIDDADRLLQWLWTDYFSEDPPKSALRFGNPSPGAWVNDHANPYLVNKAAWFTTMTTVDPALWRGAGYAPDADNLGPYWMLAQVWDDPDPARARNALQAVRDLNLGTTFIKDSPEGKRVYLVDEFLLLDDYDVRSVNMRRIARGLDPVTVDSYMPNPLPNAVLPFAQDDVFWPAYLKLCAEIGAAPITMENPVAVRLDPATLRVHRV